MELRELVQSLLAGDLLAARQCVADARRDNVQWQELPEPSTLNHREMAVAAAIVELLSARAGTPPPAWTPKVGPLEQLLVLDPGLEEMPRSFARAKDSGPEPLLKRNIVALPGFLDVA